MFGDIVVIVAKNKQWENIYFLNFFFIQKVSRWAPIKFFNFTHLNYVWSSWWGKIDRDGLAKWRGAKNIWSSTKENVEGKWTLKEKELVEDP